MTAPCESPKAGRGRQYPLNIIAVSSRPLAKGARRAAAPGSDLDLLRNLQSVIDLDAQVPHRRLKFGVAQQQLNRPQVLRALVDQCRLRAPHRVRAVGGRVKAGGHHPVLDDSRVLPGGDMGGLVQPARKEEAFGPQAGLRDPGGHGRARRLGQFELHRPLRLPLHDHGA